MRTQLSALAILLALVGAPIAVEAQAAGPTYVVLAEDTLIGIAQKFGLTLDELIQANGIADPSLIFPGTSLIIPGFEGVSGVLTTRPIAFGETLGSLAIRSGIGESDLIRLNHIVSPGRLYVGQPVIAPVQEESPSTLATGRLVLTRPGDTRLWLGASNSVNPWSIVSPGEGAVRLWVLPGRTVVVPGGEAPVSGLPEPLTAISISPDPAVQGHTEVVRVAASDPLWVEGALGPWTLRFHEEEAGEWVALQGVHALAEPGMVDLEVRILTGEGGPALDAFSQPIRLSDGDYLFDPPLDVPAETIDPAITAPEEELVSSIVNTLSAERQWEGVFQYPSLYTESFPSRFGSRRNYNGTGYLFYHTGLDFYGGTGTPILAPAPGRVLFAGPLTVRGNTTFIDHGWGIVTGYLHQSEILVSVGDTLQAGDTIGLVGATGRVTGAHLHWEIWVGGVPVDPLDWVTTSYP
jgi:murein DD-endopeptidase MepM/ murein hydrolase activator NlpD